MTTATPNPPVTPVRPAAMATQIGGIDIQRKLKESSSQVDLNESRKLSEALAIREAPGKIEVPSTQPKPVIKDQRASQSHGLDQDEQVAELTVTSNERAENPHALERFDWDDFQTRYDQAMAEAKSTEEAILNEFHELASVSNLIVS